MDDLLVPSFAQALAGLRGIVRGLMRLIVLIGIESIEKQNTQVAWRLDQYMAETGDRYRRPMETE